LLRDVIGAYRDNEVTGNIQLMLSGGSSQSRRQEEDQIILVRSHRDINTRYATPCGALPDEIAAVSRVVHTRSAATFFAGSSLTAGRRTGSSSRSARRVVEWDWTHRR